MGKWCKRHFLRSMATLGIVSFSGLPIQELVKEHFSELVVDEIYLALSWGEIWDKLRRKKGVGGSRGEGDEKAAICLIVPGGLHDVETDKKITISVWSDRPLFLWQESMVGIEVRHLRSDELMWSQPLEPEARSIIYAGKPLKPGEVYSWREALSLEEVPRRVSFKMMEAEEHTVITAELKQLESKLKAKGANANKIALERVNYFIKRGLWSDALKEIYSNSNLVSELIEKIEVYDFCKSDLLGKL